MKMKKAGKAGEVNKAGTCQDKLSSLPLNRVIILLVTILCILALAILYSRGTTLTSADKSKYIKAKDILYSLQYEPTVNYDELVDKIVNYREYTSGALNSELEQYVTSNQLSAEYLDTIVSELKQSEETISSLDQGTMLSDEDLVAEKAEILPEETWDDNLTTLEKLENRIIGKWVNAFPLSESKSVLAAYHNDTLILDEQAGTYTIAGTSSGGTGDGDGGKEETSPEQPEHSEPSEQPKINHNTIKGKDTFDNKYIVYKIEDSMGRTHNITIIIENGKVVGLGGLI